MSAELNLAWEGSDTRSFEVWAAGGAIVTIAHEESSTEFQVILVHRPRYDDWSLPKGKADPGETPEQTALREVEEETGLGCSLVARLPSITYVDHKLRSKVVHYWLMTPEDASADPQSQDIDEVDELRWVPIDEARSLLSYERDHLILDAAAQVLAAVEPSGD